MHFPGIMKPVKKLPPEVLSVVKSGVIIPTPSHAVAELVFNSIDAEATCIAVRVNFDTFKIQVIDNGHGIILSDLEAVGQSSVTSKCYNLYEFYNNLMYHGYRGQFLASLREMCKSLEIVTRASSSTVTYIKHFLPCNEEKVAKSDLKRPSQGTTVTVTDFMFNMPVRRERIKEAVELELMRSYIELIALAHPEISISLRDDAKRHITLEKCKSSGLLHAFGHLFGHSVASSLAPISFSSKKFKISGYISTKAYRHKDLQFIYINKRPAVKTKLHKFVTFLLSKSAIIKNETWKTKPIPKAVPVEKWILNPPPEKLKKCAVFVINIECARKEYELLWDIKRPLLYFEDWPGILASINDAIQTFLKQENLLGITNKEKCLQNTGHNEDGQNCRTFEVSHHEDTNSVNSKESLLKETKFSKLEVETWDLQGAVHGICVKRPKNKMQFKKTAEYNLKIKKKYTSEDSLNNTNMKEYGLKEKGIIPFDLNIQMLSDKSSKEGEVNFDVSEKMEERQEFTPLGNTEPARSYSVTFVEHSNNEGDNVLTGKESAPPVEKFLRIYETPQYAKLKITKGAYHLKKIEEEEAMLKISRNPAGSYITPLPQEHDVNTSSREMNSVPPVVKFLKMHETPQYAKLQITKAAYHWKKMEEEAMLEMAKGNSGSVDQGNKLHLTAFRKHHKKGKKIHTEVSFLKNTEQSGEITKGTHGSEVNDQTRKPIGKRKLDNLKSYYEPKFKKCKDFGNEEVSFSPSKENTMKKDYSEVSPDKPEKKPKTISFRETHSPLLDHHKSSSILCGNEYHNLFCGMNFVGNKENNVNQSSSNYLKKKTSSSIVCCADDEFPFDDKYGCRSIISFETKINKSSYECNNTEGTNSFQHFKNSIEETIEFPSPKNNNFPPFVKEKCYIDNANNITNRTEESTIINFKKLVNCSKSKSSKLNLDFSKMITVSIPTPHSDLVTIPSKSFSPLVKESKNLPNNLVCAADNLETCQPFLNASSFNLMTSIKNADPHPPNSNEILLFHDFKEENSPVQSHVQKEIGCKFSNFAVQTPSHFPTTILDGAEENNNLNISKNQRNNNSLIKFTLGEINNTFDFTNENNPFKIFDLSEAAIKPGNSGEYKSPYFKRQRRHFKENEHNSDDKRTTEVENKKEWKIQNCCSTNDKRSYSNERIKEKFSPFVPPTSMDETRPNLIISGMVVPTSDPKIVPESLDLLSRKKVCCAMNSSTNSALPLLKSCSPKQNIVSCLDQTDSNILKKHSKDSNTTNIPFTSESNEINEIMTLEPNSTPRIVDSTLRNEKLCVTKEELFVNHSKQSCNTSKSFLIKDICHILDKSANKEEDTNPVSPYFVVKSIKNGTYSPKLPDCMSHSNNYDINNKERTDATGSKANETQNNIDVSRYVTPKSHKNNFLFSFLDSDKIPKNENDTKFPCFEFNKERQSFEEQLTNIAHTSKCSSVSPRTTENINFETNISKCQVVVQNKDSFSQVHKNVTPINDRVQNDISNECGPDLQINMLPHDKNFNTVSQGDKLLENKTDISKESVEGDNFVSENLKGRFPCELPSSLMVPKDPSIYTMSSRLSFLPKGMSPLLSVPSNVLWKHSKLKADVKVNESKEISESSVGSVCQDNSSSLNEKRDVSDILSIIKLPPDKRTLSSNTQIPDLSIILAKACHGLQQDRYDKRMFKHLQVIGQLDKKFIVTMCSLQKNSTPHVLALFDQHAVHERIRLETLMKEYTSPENNWSFKSTAIPEKILLLVGSKEFRILSSYQDKFQKLGLHFQILDKDTISVFKIPTCLYSRFLRERSKQWLEETLHILIQDVVRYFIVTNGHDSLVPEVYKDVINSEACKGAIKFGDALSKHQCEELLFFLSKCDLPFFCAHGRPTFKPILDLREFEAERKKYVDGY